MDKQEMRKLRLRVQKLIRRHRNRNTLRFDKRDLSKIVKQCAPDFKRPSIIVSGKPDILNAYSKIVGLFVYHTADIAIDMGLSEVKIPYLGKIIFEKKIITKGKIYEYIGAGKCKYRYASSIEPIVMWKIKLKSPILTNKNSLYYFKLSRNITSTLIKKLHEREMEVSPSDYPININL